MYQKGIISSHHIFVPEGNHQFTPHDCQAIVVGICYDIGITIVKKVDKKHKVFCLNKKQCSDNTLYFEIFYETIRQIKEGTVNGLVINRILIPEDSKNFTQASCAFL